MSGTRSGENNICETRPLSFFGSSPCAARVHCKAAAGMTLLELIVACSILLILATVAMPLARVAVIRHREELLRYDLREMRDAIDHYKDDADKNLIQVQAGTEGYPPDLQTLFNGVQLAGAQDKRVRRPRFHFVGRSGRFRRLQPSDGHGARWREILGLVACFLL